MQRASRRPDSLARRIARQARPFAPAIVGILLLEMLTTPLVLLVPLPLKIAVDSAIGSDPLPSFLASLWPSPSPDQALVLAGGLVVVVGLLTQAHAVATRLMRARTGERLTLDLRSRLFRHAQRLSSTFHDARGVADPTYRIQSDANALRSLLVDGLIKFVGAMVTLVAMVVVTVRIDAELALIAMIVAPVLFVLAQRSRRSLRAQSREVKRLESSALGVIQEVLSALRIVKAFAQEDREQERFERAHDKGLRARMGMIWTEGRLGILLGLTTAGGTAAVLSVGVLHVREGILTLGELLLVMSYVAGLYSPLRTITRKIASVQLHLASAERAFDFLNEVPDVVERPGAHPLPRARGKLELSDVTFAYEGCPPILQGLSWRIPAGARVGIVGETGSGKTTLVGLLMRFHDTTSGCVRIDGIDVRDLRLRDLREQFGVVLQETVLFSTSIEENIAYARPEATQEEIREAARAANAHEFVSDLPDGYATRVGERGMRLSGGERQRIAIARAFLKDAPILVLDEPTSALDVRTERAVIDALERLMHGRTTILITHRASTLSACEEVVTLSGGRLVARQEVAS